MKISLRQSLDKALGINEDNDIYVGTTIDYFRENIVDLEHFIKKAKSPKQIKKMGMPPYMSLSKVLFEDHGITSTEGNQLSVFAVAKCLKEVRKEVRAGAGLPRRASVAPVVKVEPAPVVQRETAPKVVPMAPVPVPGQHQAGGYRKGAFTEKPLDVLQVDWDEDKATDFLYELFQEWRKTKRDIAWTQEIEDCINFYFLGVADVDILKRSHFHDFKDNTVKTSDILRMLKQNKRID
jgi:hypothetical protein